MADELSVEDILAIEHDVIPLDGADVFQQGEIDSIGDRVALIEDPGDFRRLPVDDARQDQVQAAAGVHLLPQLAGVFLLPLHSFNSTTRTLIASRKPIIKTQTSSSNSLREAND
jgi:hypothetical protein